MIEWRRQVLQRAADVFGGSSTPAPSPVELRALDAKIGQLTRESDPVEGEQAKAGMLRARR